ncbi:DNA repair protein RadC [Piscinibacter sp.]|uniref:RadC family protein n=1 Tax=Piscinibacter sp. TaxID=1903157 RepID=UPI003783B662
MKHLPPDARPREKLLAQGPAALADAELVALLLRTGLKGTSVLQLAQQVLDAFGGVAGLLHADSSDLKRIKGLGPAKRAELAAVVELARRSLQQRLADRPAFDSPAAVKEYLCAKLAGFEHEVFAVLFLDTQHRLIEYAEMFRGTIDSASVYPRELVKEALRLNAAAVIVSHNHPSGNPEPSRADEVLTQRLKSALALVDVRVLDHFVVGRGQIVSFAERGLL